MEVRRISRLADDAITSVMSRVGIIAATPASFGAGYIRYALDDVSSVCTGMRLGDKATPTIALI
jgi:hypothetical protein